MRLGSVDLGLVSLGISAGGTFDEGDIAGSGLASEGTGRLLDALASLRDRGLVSQNAGGSFTVTAAARGLLWDGSVPARDRLLRLLRMGPRTAREAAGLLLMPEAEASGAAEALRREGLAVMSTRLRGGRPECVYEAQGGSRASLVIDEIEGAVTEPEVDRERVLRLLRSLRGSL